MKRVAVVGGGLAGVTAAWQLAQRDRAEGDVEGVLFEASGRLGGTIETVLRDGFVVDCGADGWVTEKPWARELVRELGLHGKLIASKDEGRVTYIVSGGELVAMPDGMRMMVPADLGALEGSPLFSAEAKRAYAAEVGRAEELRASAPSEDESIASFVLRHFGEEVLRKVAAPLLSGVFGGDVRRLSVQAVMPVFVRWEREFGSLIVAARAARKDLDECEERPSIFTSLDGGAGALVDRMKAELLPDRVRLNTAVTALEREGEGWRVNGEEFDAVIVAVPADAARELLSRTSERMAELLEMEASSAVIVGMAFEEWFELPRGFGFLVPAGEENALLAGTFVDQKFPGRVPEGGRLLRAFFGAARVSAMSDEEVVGLARVELEKLLGKLPGEAFSVVRRWPRSLPQYGVGHLERMAELDGLVRGVPGLWLVGNAYRGVGLPDLIREGRAAAKEAMGLD